MSLPPAEQKTQTWRAYLITGIICVFLMAFLWGADASFRFIGAGLGGFFLFLAWFLRPRPAVVGQDPDDDDPQSESFSQLKKDLNEIFGKKKPTYKSPRTTAPRRNDPRVIIIALLFIGFVFTTIVVSVVFVSGDEEYAAEGMTSDGESLMASGQYQAAVNYYREQLRADPDNVNNLINIGNAYLSLNQNDSALNAYERALSIDNDNVIAHYNKALVMFYNKDYKASLDICQRALAIDPEYTNAMLLRGDNFYALERFDDALASYNEAYRRGERSADLLNYMAYLYDRKGDSQNAIRIYKETLQYDSSRVDVYTRLSELVSGEESEMFRRLAVKYKGE